MRKLAATVIAFAAFASGCREFGDAMQGFARALAFAVMIFMIILAVLAAAEIVGVVCVVVGVVRKSRRALGVGAGLALVACILHTLPAVTRPDPISAFEQWSVRLAVIPPAALATAIAALAGTRRRASFAVGAGVIALGTGAAQIHLAKWSAAPVRAKGSLVEGAVGYGHACYRTDLGEVVCEGGNSFGQAGGKRGVERRRPSVVPGIEGARAVAVGDDFSCALVADGTRCWGELRTIPSTWAATGLYARSGRMIAVSPNAAHLHDQHFDMRGDIPLPDGTDEIALSGHVLCARDRVGRVRCRDLEEKGNAFLAKDEVTLDVEDAVSIAGEDHVLCIERRRGRIECVDVYDAVNRHEKRVIVALDAVHPAIGPSRIVCGVRGDMLVCAQTRPVDIMRDEPPPVRSLRLPSAASSVFGGYAGLCALLVDHSLACLKHDDRCLAKWVDGVDACTPALASTPITYDDQ